MRSGIQSWRRNEIPDCSNCGNCRAVWQDLCKTRRVNSQVLVVLATTARSDVVVCSFPFCIQCEYKILRGTSQLCYLLYLHQTDQDSTGIQTYNIYIKAIIAPDSWGLVNRRSHFVYPLCQGNDHIPHQKRKRKSSLTQKYRPGVGYGTVFRVYFWGGNPGNPKRNRLIKSPVCDFALIGEWSCWCNPCYWGTRRSSWSLLAGMGGWMVMS